MSKKLSLLTLAVALVLALTGTGHADPSEYASFDLVVGGALGVDGIWGSEPGAAQIKKKMNHVDSDWPPGMKLHFKYFFEDEFDGNGAACFDEEYYYGPFGVWQDRDGLAHATIYFRAKGKDSSPDHKYALHLFGTFDAETNFVPTSGPVTMDVTRWEMSTEGKGQARKVTCTGDGEILPDDVTVVVIPK